VALKGWCFSSIRSDRYPIGQSRTRVVPDRWSPSDPQSQQGSIGTPRQVTSQWWQTRATRSTQLLVPPLSTGTSAMRGTLTKARPRGGDPLDSLWHRSCSVGQ
jgi:hypothetical protein